MPARNIFEGFPRPGHPEHIVPKIDHYRQIWVEKVLPQPDDGIVCSMGTPTKLVPLKDRTYQSAVDITTPGHFTDALEYLIMSTKLDHTRSRENRFATNTPTVMDIDDTKKYRKDLNDMYTKLTGLHSGILKKCTKEEKEKIEQMMTEARAEKRRFSTDDPEMWTR